MTPGMLESNKMKQSEANQALIDSAYIGLGTFYEHNDALFDFRDEDLENFVKEHNKDPAYVKHADIFNWFNEFADRLDHVDDLLIMQLPHKEEAAEIIANNYSKYAVFEAGDVI